MTTLEDDEVTRSRHHLACFGRFELDLATGELRRDGRLRRLPPQPARLLCHLVTRAGHLVTRDELRQLLWEGRAVEADQGLNACMLQIRRALGDRARNPLFVRTLPRQGYCFIAPVTVAEAPETSVPSSSSASAPSRPHARLDVSVWLLVLSLLAIGVVVAVVMDSSRDGSATPQEVIGLPDEEPPRVVVLPFRSLGDQDRDRYFAEGLTEEITTALARERALAVIAPDSARVSAEQGATLGDLAEWLQVDYVLEGTARREGGRYRVSARLSDARAETLVWSRSYDRRNIELLDVQAELARTVVTSLVTHEIAAQSSAESRGGLSKEPSDAQESFLIGRHLLRHGRPDQLSLAIDYLEAAVEKEPRMAGAQLALAAGRHRAGDSDAATYRRAVLDALDLDPELASAHLALGRLELYSDWDFDGAERSYRMALRHEPSYAQGHHALAMLMAIVGRSDEAIEHIERARSLDPVSFTLFADAGLVYFMAGRFQESVEVCSRALEIEPDRLGLLRCRLDAHLQLGDVVAALEDAERLMTRSGASAESLAVLATGTVEERLEGFYRWQLRSLQESSAPPTALAAALLPLGEIDRCFEQLELAFETRSSGVLMVPSDPRAAQFKDDPRLVSLVERIGLAI